MRFYQSTRNPMLKAVASKVVLQGLADDGGLYMLNDLEDLHLDVEDCLDLNYQQLATKILGLFLDDFTNEELADCVRNAYNGKFSNDEITPLVKVNDDYILELFHGPTSAFKDMALLLLPQLMQVALKKQELQDDILILTATSGDTGKAALEGFKNLDRIHIMVFYPDSGVSAIQKRQMMTQEGNNVGVCAIEGNFDDAQSAVKRIFTSEKLKEFAEEKHIQFSTANSINFGRLVPQIVYYYKAYIDLVHRGEIECGELVDFVVPTGNFGNILAGTFAKRLGLPVHKLVCASNSNHVLTDFMQTGLYDKRREFLKTTSPSMDILVSSNLERYLYMICDKDEKIVKRYMEDLQRQMYYQLSDDQLARLKEDFYAGYSNDEETLKTISSCFRQTGYLLDPHTAVGYKVCQQYKQESKTPYKKIVLATASPYKFVRSIGKSLGLESVDEFELMKQIASVTRTEIPVPLQILKNKEILHRNVIKTRSIDEYVKERIKVWQE